MTSAACCTSLLNPLASGYFSTAPSFGERSAMTVQTAQDAGLSSACHMEGGSRPGRRAADPASNDHLGRTMTNFAPVSGLVGGALIGIAAIILMLTIGRIAGVSGIALNAMTPSDAAGRSWRLAFILGLPLGALLVTAVGLKDWSSISFPASMSTTVIAGFIVGVGSTFGSGCTSGHGICGLARFSMRSIVATVTFIATAAATVFVTRHLV